MHLGIPCNSWTRARDRGPLKLPGVAGWPSRLRSDQEPWGLAALVNPPDIAAVLVGNTLARLSVSLMRICRRLGLPFSAENPALSRLWGLPPFRQMLRWAGASWQVTHYCLDGMPWKKPTGLLGYLVDLDPVVRRCSGRLCERTGRCHQPLTGRSPAGPLWTLVAQPYPKPLAWRLARALVSARVGSAASRLSRVWCGCHKSQ